jgi:hypothetical protein
MTYQLVMRGAEPVVRLVSFQEMNAVHRLVDVNSALMIYLQDLAGLTYNVVTVSVKLLYQIFS